MAKKKQARSTPKVVKSATSSNASKYPRHTLEKALRIPQAILEQNAGKECSEKDSASYVGVKFNKGPYMLEVSSALKYGLLERPAVGRLKLTDLAKKILKPQTPSDR